MCPKSDSLNRYSTMRDNLGRLSRWMEERDADIQQDFAFLDDYDRQLNDTTIEAIEETLKTLKSYLPVCDRYIAAARNHHERRTREAMKRRIERVIMKLEFLLEN